MLGPRFIGRYKVIEEIGRGGMGIVYRGEDPRLERAVAIKVLPPRKTPSTKALERFKREARVCARLDHPYILKIYDYCEEEGSYQIVMEFVEGVTLREVIGEDPDPADLDIPEMARLFGQICQALEYAHALQITHRDIKPENIMVTTSAWGSGRGKVKVMDFGLAVLENRHSLTMDGAVMGTIAYLSPEQAHGDRADHRSDIYSMGAVFYEMLTGHLPFEAESVSEMLRRHLESPAPSPRILNPAVHPVLERIVITCMRKDPADRYQSVRAIREDLEGYRAAAQISADYFWGSSGVISGEDRVAEQMPRPASASAATGRASSPSEPAEAPSWGTGAPLAPSTERRAFEDPGRRGSDDEMRDWRESEEVFGFNPPGTGGAEALDVPSLASPMTPGLPAELARRLDPSRQAGQGPGAGVPTGFRGDGEGPGFFGGGMQQTAADDAGRFGMLSREANPPGRIAPELPNRAPTSGAAPIASKEWMQEAEGGQDPWGKYQQVLSRLQRDEAATGGELEVLNIPPTICGRCGIENPGDRKYCHECGTLLAPSQYQMTREAATYNDKGLVLMRRGRYSEAVYEFQQALLRDASMSEAHKNLGIVWARLSEPAQAETELRQAASLSRTDPEPFVELAHLYREAGRRPEAMQALADALRRAPEDSLARCQLAFLHSHGNDLVRAVEEYRTVLAYDPQCLEAHLQLGIIYGSQNLVAEAIGEFEAVVRLDPQNSCAYQWLGQLYARRNRFGDAERAYQSALTLNSTNPDVYAELGSLYSAQRREDFALKQLSQAIRLDPGHVEARSELASLYLKSNRPAMAIQQLEEVLTFHPQDAGLHQQLGDIYLSQHQMDRALVHFERCVSLDPASADLHNRLGQLYLKKDYDALSIQEYQKAVALDPYQPGFHEDLGMAYYVNRQKDAAIAELKKAAILDARNLDYCKALGVMCEEEGRLEEAVQYLKRALELVPRDADAHGLLGRIYGRQGMLNLAVLEFQKALETRPDNQLMLIYLARSYAELAKLDSAIDCFKQAIGLISGHGESPEARRALARSYLELARTYVEAGDVRSAREVAESALGLTPDDARALHVLGQVLRAQGDHKKALEYLTSALQREPQNPDLLADLGTLYADRGEHDMAIKAIRKALRINPERSQYYEQFSAILAAQGQYDEAAEALRKAMGLNPRHAPHYHYLQGELLRQQKRWPKAAAEYQLAISQDAWNWQFYQGLARTFEELGRYDEARAGLEKALSLKVPEREVRVLQEDLKRLRSRRR